MAEKQSEIPRKNENETFADKIEHLPTQSRLRAAFFVSKISSQTKNHTKVMNKKLKTALIFSAVALAGIILERKFGITDKIPVVRNMFNA